MRLIRHLKVAFEAWKVARAQEIVDYQREFMIATYAERASQRASEGDFAAARMWFDDMCAEIAKRSPEQVARMERKRGLR